MEPEFDETEYTNMIFNYKIDGVIDGKPFTISRPGYYYSYENKNYITKLIESGSSETDMDENIVRLIWNKVEEQYSTKIREWFKEIDENIREYSR